MRTTARKNWRKGYRMLKLTVSSFLSLSSLEARISTLRQQLQTGLIPSSADLDAEASEVQAKLRKDEARREKFFAIEVAHALAAQPGELASWGEAGGKLSRTQFLARLRGLPTLTVVIREKAVNELFNLMTDDIMALKLDHIDLMKIKQGMKKLMLDEVQRAQWEPVRKRCDELRAISDALARAAEVTREVGSDVRVRVWAAALSPALPRLATLPTTP